MAAIKRSPRTYTHRHRESVGAAFVTGEMSGTNTNAGIPKRESQMRTQEHIKSVKWEESEKMLASRKKTVIKTTQQETNTVTENRNKTTQKLRQQNRVKYK